MRISDWSSDVCSSDLASSCNGRFSAWGKRNDIVFPPSVRPELVEGLFFFRGVERQGRPFDKLRTNGFGYWSFCMTRGPWHVAVLMGGWSAERAVSLMSRSEEHTSELQSLMRISYAVFCLKQKKSNT